MRRRLGTLALFAALAAPAQILARGLEAVRLGGEEQWRLLEASLKAIGPLRTALHQRDQSPPRRPLLQDPRLKPLDPAEAPGRTIGSVRLPDLLDRHRTLIARQLGSLAWGISMAGDAAFKNTFLTFAREAALVIAPVGDLNRLRGDGVTVTIAPGVTYNLRVSINILDPVRGSTLKITAVNKTNGPSHEIKTGVILAALKAKSYVFKSKGKEYWLLHGTDVDPATNTLAGTRSLLFIHEEGLSSKAWPLAESSLGAGQPVSVALDDTRLVLVRDDQGGLSISEPSS